MSKGNKGFSNEQLNEIIRLSHIEGMKSRQIAAIIGCSKTSVNYFLRRERHLDFWEEYDKKPVATATTVNPEQRRRQLKGKRFFFTCAQNNTYVHRKFLQAIEVFAEHRDCQIVVGKSYYNKNGFQSKNSENEDEVWFDPKIKPYALAEHMVVTPHLLWLGDLNIIPTAVNPLSGFHNFTKKESGIIPHCKVNMQSLPTHKDDPEKMLYTTGSVTYPNFIPQKAGQKAEFHHIFGGLYVEIDDDGDWFARQIQAESDTGQFYDLNEYFTPDGVEVHDDAVEAINWGDLHVEKLDPIVAECSFGVKVVGDDDSGYSYVRTPDNGNMLDVLKPKYQFAHDTSDFTPRNHHNISDPHFRYKTFVSKQDTVEGAMKRCADCLAAMTRPFVETVVVESNHDLALVRWLKTADYKTDPANALFFIETQLKVYTALAKRDEEYNVFADVMRSLNDDLYTNNVTFLNTDESFRLFGENGIECGWHGHTGCNGARGSTQGFTRVGIRVNIGHQHSAGITEGVYVAGVSGSLQMGYNVGPSSWSASHIITFKNGKRAIITIRNGKWRA